jgi:hypothetical protein
MPPDPLSGPKSKIGRAHRHIADLYHELADFFGANPFGMVGVVDPKSKDRFVKIILTEDLPDDAFHSVAEAVYQLRSALDQMVIAIARANGNAAVDDSYFPFAGSQREFESKGTQNKIKLLPTDVRDMIHGLAPYKGGDNELWGLSRLSNIDKHRNFIPAGVMGTTHTLQNLIIRGAKEGFRFPMQGRLDEGIEVVNLGPTGEFSSTTPLDQPNFGISADVTFGNVDIFDGGRVGPTLVQLAQRVDQIVRMFGSHCFGT